MQRHDGFGDYLNSAYRDGFYDQASQYWIIRPSHEICERDGFLVIGGPGVDGIEFGYRRGHAGVWAYYPMEDDFVYLAESVSALVDSWRDGTITV